MDYEKLQGYTREFKEQMGYEKLQKLQGYIKEFGTDKLVYPDFVKGEDEIINIKDVNYIYLVSDFSFYKALMYDIKSGGITGFSFTRNNLKKVIEYIRKIGKYIPTTIDPEELDKLEEYSKKYEQTI